MNDKQSHIQQQVEETLHALDHVKRATTDDTFFARLDHRMKRHNVDGPEPAPSHSTIWSIAAVMLLILVNIITLVHYNQASSSSTTQVQQQEVATMAQEYFPTDPTIYQKNQTP